MKQEPRTTIGREEFDYQTLLSALSGYASPRDRITALMRSGAIIRVKKGLYVFGDHYRREPFCRELLANLAYGPSCISLEYALAYHGLIPEKVDVLTSVTTGRQRRFDTPVGTFLYRPTPSLAEGMERVGTDDTHYLISVPERALADRIRADRQGPIRSKLEMERYLLENLRIDPSGLAALDAPLLEQLAQSLRSRKIHNCAKVVQTLRRRK